MHDIGGLLSHGAVDLQMTPASKDEWIRQLVDLLCEKFGLVKKDRILDAVLRREATHSTAIGHGVAVPHAKTDAVPSLVMACGLVKSGVDFDAPDEEPVRVAFLMVSPASEAGPHVKALGSIGRIMLQESVRESIAGARTEKELIQIIRHAEENI